ncbi:MAG: nucleotide exchange factor GrpE [Leptospiraceae bacterium]|nr:nucleotide exchange factor GrpE [Leptospiraceae bacterium]MCP5498388.1 nucleotide exchange factor GrpE [Leptospiraceae bacterium]
MSENQNTTESEEKNTKAENGDNGSSEKKASNGSEEVIQTEEIQSNTSNTSSDELQKANQEIEKLKDSWARERAEFQNYKRRTAAEFVNIRRESVKNFVLKLLTPMDNLERVSQQNVSDDVKPFLDGVQMIKKEIYSVFEKENIFRVQPINEPFDPMTMEAIAALESEEYQEETVIEVYQSGFEFRENSETMLIRPSRVRVGRPKN